MTTAQQWIAHYTRLLAGSLSPSQRAQAEHELDYWREQERRQSPPPPQRQPEPRSAFQPDALARWAVRVNGGSYQHARTA